MSVDKAAAADDDYLEDEDGGCEVSVDKAAAADFISQGRENERSGFKYFNEQFLLLVYVSFDGIVRLETLCNLLCSIK